MFYCHFSFSIQKFQFSTDFVLNYEVCILVFLASQITRPGLGHENGRGVLEYILYCIQKVSVQVWFQSSKCFQILQRGRNLSDLGEIFRSVDKYLLIPACFFKSSKNFYIAVDIFRNMARFSFGWPDIFLFRRDFSEPTQIFVGVVSVFWILSTLFRTVQYFSVSGAIFRSLFSFFSGAKILSDFREIFRTLVSIRRKV